MDWNVVSDHTQHMMDFNRLYKPIPMLCLGVRAFQVVKRQRGLLQVLHRRAPLLLELLQHLLADLCRGFLARSLRILPALPSDAHD